MAADYKQKYLDIRAKFLEATDVAYRIGHEEGMKKGKEAAQMEQQAMEQQAMAQAMGGGGMPPGAEGGMPPGAEEGGMPPEEGMEEGAPPEEMGEGEAGDIDEHISELESLVSKGEKPSVLTMRRAVEKLSDVRKSQKSSRRKKSTQNTSSQKKFVDKILKSWDKEKKDVTEGIEDIIKESGLKLED